MYADYEFYKNTYKGNKISPEEFENLAERASDFLDYITRGRLENGVPSAEKDAVKIRKACCAVADAYKSISAAEQSAQGMTGIAGAGAIKSISSGGESLSFGDSAVSLALSKGRPGINNYLFNEAKTYLSGVTDDRGTAYLYWGL